MKIRNEKEEKEFGKNFLLVYIYIYFDIIIILIKKIIKIDFKNSIINFHLRYNWILDNKILRLTDDFC